MSKMQELLEKARRKNKLYKTEQECNAMNEEEMDEVRKQVEAETAEIIVCLQENINAYHICINALFGFRIKCIERMVVILLFT